MAVLNEDTKDRIINYVNDFYRCEHHTPSVREIAAELAVGKSTIHNYLKYMNESGEVQYDGKSIVTGSMSKFSISNVNAPVVGVIGCGDPTAEEENIEEYVDLPEAIFGKGDLYMLRTYGDSMIDSGIVPGTLVVIDKNSRPRKNDIVVVLNKDNENTLKKYLGKHDGKYLFAYMNEEKYPGEKFELDSFVCQGVVRHIIRTF